MQDRYGNPGSPVTTTDARGQNVIHVYDGSMFLTGRGASKEGDYFYGKKQVYVELR